MTHAHGQRRRQWVGPTKADKRKAEEIACEINAGLTLGTFVPDPARPKPLRCDAELRRWHLTYAPTFKPSYQGEAERIIENHLVPFFGPKDLRELRETDLLDFVRAKLDAGLAPRQSAMPSRSYGGS
jgi:hypothetical protein